MTLMIGVSLLLVAGSAIALVFGWATVNSSLIWTSIAASIGSAVFLALAYYGSRSRREDYDDEDYSEEEDDDREEPTSTAAMPAIGSDDEEVVAIPERRRYHLPDCRYARVKGAEKMSRSAARRRGYDACNICRP